MNPNEEVEDGTEGKLREEEPEEIKPISSPPVPVLPSREEVLKHRLTHRPFRNWCPHCTKGKGREDKHKQSTQKHVVSDVPKIVSDYFFIGRRRASGRAERAQDEEVAEREGQTPILVIKDTASKALFAHACPCKGTHEAVVAKVCADLL